MTFCGRGPSNAARIVSADLIRMSSHASGVKNAECGVMMFEGERLTVARAAPRRSREGLPFGVWMALAKATPLPVTDDDLQKML